jgi:hypothetical protein
LKVVEKIVPQIKQHFGERPWSYQHDGAPSHSADLTQEWLRSNTPDFIQVKA